MRILKTLVVSLPMLLTASVTATAQASRINVTGVWTGTFAFDGTGAQQRSAYLKLDQKDSVVTGTAGPDADGQAPISKGRITTAKGVTTITFEVGQPDGPPLRFELQVVEGRLKGKATAEANGEKREAAIDVGRGSARERPLPEDVGDLPPAIVLAEQ